MKVPESLAYWLALSIALVLAFVSMGTRAPLSDVHGDSPIYVYHGKRFAETNLLADYSRSASTIAANVAGASLGDAGFWSPYWHFTRLGQVALVGATVSMFGAGMPSIVALQWLFAGLATLAVLLSVANALALTNLLDVRLTREKALLGGALSAALFLLSDISGYLGRSFISETPSAAILAAATLLFIYGQKKRSLAWSAASGLLSFLLYVVRAEAIWPYLVFLAVCAGSQWRLTPSNFWYAGYAAALVTSLACWMGYFAWMFPLPDPRYFLALAKLSDVDPGEATPHRLSGSIGLLLVGVVLSFAIRGQRRTWLVPLAWSAVALLPTLPYLMEGRSVQTRMFVPYLLLPAFTASTFGWAKLFSMEPSRFRHVGGLLVGVAVGLLVMLSVPTLYEFTRSLPGLWRVQAMNAVIGPWLRLPPWEEHTYDVGELNDAARAIMRYGRAGPVIADDGLRYGNLYLLRFFMERYPSSARLVTQGEPVSPQSTCPSGSPGIERHRYCGGLAGPDVARLIRETGGAYLVESVPSRNPAPDPHPTFVRAPVHAGKHLRIWYLESSVPQG